MALRSSSQSCSRDVDFLVHRPPCAEDHHRETAISTTALAVLQVDIAHHQWVDRVEGSHRADDPDLRREDLTTAIRAGEAEEEEGVVSVAVATILGTGLDALCPAHDLGRLHEALHTRDLGPGAHRDVGAAAAAATEGVNHLVEVEAQLGAAGGAPATAHMAVTAAVEAGAGVGGADLLEGSQDIEPLA